MKAAILALVIIGVLFAIASGVWVAIALVRAISKHRVVPAERYQLNEKNSD